MKLVVKGAELAGAVRHVRSVTDTRATLPILSGILMQATVGSLSLHGTDLEQSLVITVPADVQEPGSVVLNAERLAAICKEMAGDEISVHAGKDMQTTVKGPGGKFTLPGLSAEDFPVTGTSDGNELAIHVKGALLSMGIGRVVFCASTDESRYSMNGVNILLDESSATLAATDGHRLAYLTVPLGEPVDSKCSIIVATDAAKQLQDMLDNEGDCIMTLSPRNLGATVGAARFTTRLIEGTFPNTQVVAGQAIEHPHRFAIETKLLQDAIRRACLMSDERSKPVKMAFEGNNVLTISARTPDVGDAEISVPVSRTTVDGSDITVGFNGKYMLDWLAIAPAKMEMRLKDATCPMAMLADGAPDYIVMPIRL